MWCEVLSEQKSIWEGKFDPSDRKLGTIADKNQMSRMKLKDREPSAEMYAIIRVFKLDKGRTDMRLSVDPAGMQGRELQVRPESFSVVPKSKTGS